MNDVNNLSDDNTLKHNKFVRNSQARQDICYLQTLRKHTYLYKWT